LTYSQHVVFRIGTTRLKICHVNVVAYQLGFQLVIGNISRFYFSTYLTSTTRSSIFLTIGSLTVFLPFIGFYRD